MKALAFSTFLTSARHELNGFPWRIAAILYATSWGGSLLLPNTLFWDDWQYISNQPDRSLNSIFLETGLPPWRAVFDQELLLLGYATIPALTFLMYFGSGLFLFLILKRTNFLENSNMPLLILVFMTSSVNHARIAKVMFGYTTSYFLFFAAWAFWAYSRSMHTRLAALLLFFLSFMTHSFLIFLILPLIHTVFLQNSQGIIQKVKEAMPSILALLTVAITYVCLRSIYWQPQNRFINYQKIYANGVFRSLILLVPFIVCLLVACLWSRFGRGVPKELKKLLIGTFALAVALLPYLISNNIDRYIFSFNIGWQSRHLMLTPLGFSFVVVGISQLISKKNHYIAKLALTLSVLVNIFVGSQYYLQSVQQSEITNLFKRQNIPGVVAEFGDETARFKGRGATYSEYELFGMLNEAGYSYPKQVGYKFVCKANPDGIKLTVKSDESFFDALLSRNTGTYFEITTCAEVLSQQG